jgi:hypothetical protein
MIVNDTVIDSIGTIRKLCTLSNGDGIMWQFKYEPTNAELLQLESDYFLQHQYDSIPEEKINIYDEVCIMKDFVQKVKATPSITLAQYNTYLGTKQWWEAAIIRYFIYKLAMALAKDQGLIFSDYTENQVLAGVRSYINSTSTGKLAKILGFSS